MFLFIYYGTLSISKQTKIKIMIYLCNFLFLIKERYILTNIKHYFVLFGGLLLLWVGLSIKVTNPHLSPLKFVGNYSNMSP